MKETDKVFFGDNQPIANKSFLKANESGTARLVQTACKTFARGADEKNGIHAPFQAHIRSFLDENKMKSIPLVPYPGNRFNILFENAGNVSFLSPHMTEFLQGYQNNMLLTAVLKYLNVPEYLAGCKALGLVSKLITVPLWCQIEDCDTHIMDMDNIYHQVVEYISSSEDKLDEFMNGKLILPFADEEKTRKNEIFQCLILDWEHDHLVKVHLKVILPALLAVAKKLFSDHLEGGKWKDVNHDLREKTAGVPKHNEFSESIFGHIERII